MTKKKRRVRLETRQICLKNVKKGKDDNMRRRNYKYHRTGNKAVFYGRFSCDKQQEQSITGQLDECNKFAKREGYEIVKSFKDEALSGRDTTKRIGLNNMFEYIKYHEEIAYIIVYKIDRLSRSVCDINKIKKEMGLLGVRVLKATEVNGEGAAGFLTDAMFESYAEYYSWELSEKTARGMAQSAKNGTSTGTTPPYGYKWVEKKLVVDDTQAPVAKMIFDWYADGWSKKQIAEQLNKLGYTNRKGKQWSYKDFENMLKNRKYIGEWWLLGELANPHGNEPIIDIDTFNKVQEMLAVNKQQAGGKHRQKREYACSGKIYCMRCGSPMIAIGGLGRGDKKYYYYACKSARCKECDKKNERQDVIDSWVVDEIKKQFYLSEDRIDIVAEDIAKIYQQCTDDGTLEIKKNNLRKATIESEKLLNLMLQVSDSDLLIAKFASINERIKSLKAEISELETSSKMLPQVDEIKVWLHNLLEKGTNQTSSIRELINTCIARIYVDNGERGIIIWQLGNRIVDNDTIDTIVAENKNSTYTELCIGANEPGSPDWT